MVDKVIVDSVFKSDDCIFANVTILNGADSRVATYMLKNEEELPTDDSVVLQIKKLYNIL
jgi:hypothetical protein